MKIENIVLGLITVSLIISSCSDNLNIPIWEKLPEDVVSNYSEHDSNFLEFVSECEMFAKWMVNNEDISRKYGNVTYSQLYKFQRHGYEYYEENKRRLEEEFLKENPIFKEREKKFYTYLEEYEEIKPESVINIVLVDKEIDDTPWKRNVALTFEIEPLRGVLENIEFTCCFRTKNGKAESEKVYFTVDSKISESYRFRSRIEGHIYDDTVIELIYNKSLEEITDSYDVIIDAWSYKVNGKYKGDYPFVSQYLNAKDEWSKDTCYEKIFENIFGIDVMTPVRYIRNKCNEECVRYDRQVANMYIDYGINMLFSY